MDRGEVIAWPCGPARKHANFAACFAGDLIYLNECDVGLSERQSDIDFRFVVSFIKLVCSFRGILGKTMLGWIGSLDRRERSKGFLI